MVLPVTRRPTRCAPLPLHPRRPSHAGAACHQGAHFLPCAHTTGYWRWPSWAGPAPQGARPASSDCRPALARANPGPVTPSSGSVDPSPGEGRLPASPPSHPHPRPPYHGFLHLLFYQSLIILYNKLSLFVSPCGSTPRRGPDRCRREGGFDRPSRRNDLETPPQNIAAHPPRTAASEFINCGVCF